jgi:predicted O-linked N-acetylglucosamine transferase (SPINDLY family)
MQEWHTEAIHRLARCFIAWQPSKHFPEASIDVAEAPSGGIRFGSFNHTRKFSDANLQLWGQLLESIPDSSLVLKANASGDTSTQELLRRRMLRAGLNPERVHWLPFMATSRDHLHQYAQIDIALDCFPNGGCTTTCEALWMGVPVITLTGRSYVSRMSTAVLHGAGLPEWCAASPQAYLDLAISQAGELSRLRQSRDHWRRQVQTNPLGDAADLMQHLEGAFTSLYQQRCAALAASR